MFDYIPAKWAAVTVGAMLGTTACRTKKKQGREEGGREDWGGGEDLAHMVSTLMAVMSGVYDCSPHARCPTTLSMFHES